jgi:hypothetical protein
MSPYHEVNKIAQKKNACLHEHIQNSNLFNVGELNLTLLE